MSMRHFDFHKLRLLTMFALIAVLIASTAAESMAQVIIGGGDGRNNNNVGGVSINPQGVLQKIDRKMTEELAAARRAALRELPADFQESTELRHVSLKQLIAEVQTASDNNDEHLPPHIQFMAGLTRIKYVFVYPELGDIVLAGPAEGWVVDASGDVVGAETGSAILQLDDFLVSLRMVSSDLRQTATVSIEPTAEGQRNLNRYTRTLKSIGNAKKTLAAIEDHFGPQQILLTGVPKTSRFARVLVSADYQMKRLALGHDKAPVRGMPAFTEMLKSPRQMTSMSPRWWISDNYDAIHVDGAGLAFELRGPGLKVMTEDEFATPEGERVGTGRANPIAQRWADNMTSKFDELSLAMPIFAELRNCMDLAVISALIIEEGLPQKAGLDLSLLLDENAVVSESYDVPKTVPPIASVLKRRSGYVITVSGGVEVNPWKVAANREKNEALATVHQEAAPSGDKWYW